MKKYKYLIYDDNISDCEKLCNLIYSEISSEILEIHIAETKEKSEAFLKNGIDVIFIDIELEENKNGIKYACSVKESYPDIKIIFITAHIKYCEEIFWADPSGFLLKPFTESRVSRTLRILKNYIELDEYLVLKNSKNDIKILLNQISYIEGNNRHLIFYDNKSQKVCEVNGKFSLIEDRLPDYFLRCHHSFCVNLKYVNDIHRYEMIFNCEDVAPVPVSQQKYKTSKERFLKYLGDSI